ncbi:hypothetical protein Q7A53_18315 [Halobacillus rhizosphaerae]|uniref:hypothetical protein n=1 Tax=Halobacillus rhizosphaerae TaxID=3064889 RepID=UPI00398AA815
MSNVFDFEQYKFKKDVKNQTQNKAIIVEVYITTVKFVCQYLDITYDHPVEYVTSDMELELLYCGDRDRFIKTFTAIITYWGIETGMENVLPPEEEFERFKTIGDLCIYIEKRVK